MTCETLHIAAFASRLQASLTTTQQGARFVSRLTRRRMTDLDHGAGTKDAVGAFG